MNKSQLLKEIVAALGESLETLERAARASHNEATHESSRAESKYDTRGLEAAYLAGHPEIDPFARKPAPPPPRPPSPRRV